MKEKLLNILNKLKSFAQKLYSWSPFLSGLILGYFGKAEIKFLLSLLFKLFHLL